MQRQDTPEIPTNHFNSTVLPSTLPYRNEPQRHGEHKGNEERVFCVSLVLF